MSTLKFSTVLLDEIIESRRKQREERRLKLLEEIHKAVSQLSSEIAFKEVYIFGSVTKPYRFLEDSDIDIGIIGLKDEDLFRAIALLSDLLGREVDVLQLEGHRMEKKVKREGIRWTKVG